MIQAWQGEGRDKERGGGGCNRHIHAALSEGAYLDIRLQGPALPFQGGQSLGFESSLSRAQGAGQGPVQVSQQACPGRQVGMQLPGRLQTALQPLHPPLQPLPPLRHLCRPPFLPLPFLCCPLCSLYPPHSSSSPATSLHAHPGLSQMDRPAKHKRRTFAIRPSQKPIADSPRRQALAVKIRPQALACFWWPENITMDA